MASLVCIVEGHGEVQAVPVLIWRIAPLVTPNLPLQVPQPIRVPGDQLFQPDGLERYMQLAAAKTRGQGAIFILLDADDVCPKTRAPELLQRAVAARGDVPMGLVLARREYESWFLAAAESLRGHRGLPDDLVSPENFEDIRGAKEWLRDRTPHDRKYSPTADQAALTAAFDMDLARSRSDSFDKCYREIERLLRQLEQAATPPSEGPALS